MTRLTRAKPFFFHDAIPTSFSNPDAMHVIVFDKIGAAGVSGALIPPQKIYLYNIHERALVNNGDVYEWGSTLNHELGHRFELCHAFSTFNTAPDMNPAAECGGPTPGVTECKPEMGSAFPCPTPAPGTAYPTSCADNDCYTCYCTWGTGNNFMGYTLPRKGVTISQWAQMYGDAISEMPSFLGFETCMPPKSPVIINANTNVVWEVPKFMPNDIEILTGSQLTIKCEVLMGPNNRIVVHRGAKLLIDGGTITTLCPGSFWSGIFVHGFTNAPQPSPGAMPGPNQSGIVYVDNFATI